jgi:thiamine biosynthesis lipoprotein
MRWNRGCSGRTILQFLFLALTQAQVFAQTNQLVYRKEYAMGSVFEIAAYSSSPSRASRAIDKAFVEVIRLDHIMSDYDPSSDLSRINRTAHYRAELVPVDLYRVIQQSLAYSKLSNGKFDITVGPLSRLWKKETRGGSAPSAVQLKELLNCIGWQKVVLVPPDRVEFRSPCMALDLGAIGKGYAVDRAVTVLRSFGVKNALISAGGSTIYGMGSPPGLPAWVVHLRDPSKKLSPAVRLNGNSVSTSEQTRNPRPERTPFGHIIDPVKGIPITSPYSVSVVADSATESDALSTTLLLMGPAEGKAVLQGLPNIAAVWISSRGKSEYISNGPRISMNHLTDTGH